MPAPEKTLQIQNPGFLWIRNHSTQDSETTTWRQAPKRSNSKNVLTSGDPHNVLISKFAQAELSWSYFLRLRRLGPLGSTPGFHWVQRQEIPAVLQGADAVWEFEWSSRDHVIPIGYDYDKCSFHKAVIFHVLLATVAYFLRDENTGAMRRF